MNETASDHAAPIGISRLLGDSPSTESLFVVDRGLRLAASFSAAFLNALPGCRLMLLRRLREAHSDLVFAATSEEDASHLSLRPTIPGDLVDHRATYTDAELGIAGQQVMQSWEAPYMAALARPAGETGGEVLEIGFGMGISASILQGYSLRSHTIVECHPEVLRRCEQWTRSYPGRDIRVVAGKWQEVIDRLGSFDAVIFDAYPQNEMEWLKYYANDTTYAEHFFPTASRLLREGGVFSYYTNEADSLSRDHQRAILRHFARATISRVDGLTPPIDCHYWQSSSMLVVVAQR